MGENVVLIAESDLARLMETAYLWKSPRNAEQLFEALEQSVEQEQQPVVMQSSVEAIAQPRLEQSSGLSLNTLTSSSA